MTGVLVACVIGGSLAVGLILTQRRHMKNVFDNSLWANSAVVNPLYKDRTLRFENPLYQDPKNVNINNDDEQ